MKTAITSHSWSTLNSASVATGAIPCIRPREALLLYARCTQAPSSAWPRPVSPACLLSASPPLPEPRMPVMPGQAGRPDENQAQTRHLRRRLGKRAVRHPSGQMRRRRLVVMSGTGSGWRVLFPLRVEKGSQQRAVMGVRAGWGRKNLEATNSMSRCGIRRCVGTACAGASGRQEIWKGGMRDCGKRKRLDACVYVHACMCVCLRACTQACVYACAYVCRACIRMYVNVCDFTNTCVRTYMHTCIHSGIHACTCTTCTAPTMHTRTRAGSGCGAATSGSSRRVLSTNVLGAFPAAVWTWPLGSVLDFQIVCTVVGLEDSLG